MTGKIEYLHVDFGSDTAPTSSPQNARPIAIDFRSRITEDLVRLGLNYKFDPYVAVYKIAAPVSKSSERSPVIYKAPVTALWTWTGYYLGINAGYSWGRSRTEGIFNDSVAGTASATSSSFRLDGKVFGIQTGYNFQFGSLLLGIEADAQLTGQRANPTFMCPATICNPGGPVVAAFDQSQKLEWFATLRARFGIAVTPHAIMYVTGGAAVAGLMTSGTLFGFDPTGATPISNPFGNITINAGWTVGGGVETHLCGNWAGKVEYLYVNLGSMTTNQNNQQSGMTLTAAFNSRMSDQIARVGLNYKFD